MAQLRSVLLLLVSLCLSALHVAVAQLAFPRNPDDCIFPPLTVVGGYNFFPPRFLLSSDSTTKLPDGGTRVRTAVNLSCGTTSLYRLQLITVVPAAGMVQHRLPRGLLQHVQGRVEALARQCAHRPSSSTLGFISGSRPAATDTGHPCSNLVPHTIPVWKTHIKNT
jgi:hypothetical protein